MPIDPLTYARRWKTLGVLSLALLIIATTALFAYVECVRLARGLS